MTRFTVSLLAILVLFMLAGVFPVQGGMPATVFRTPVFILLLALLFLATLVCCRRHASLRHAGFLLTHLGVVILLAGACVGFVFGKRTDAAIPLAAQHCIRELPREDGTPVPLGFGISITNFTVEYYQPHYNLFRPVSVAPASPRSESPSEKESSYEFVKKVPFSKDGVLRLGKLGEVPASALKDSVTGAWLRQHILENGWVLQMVRTPKRYAAAMRFTSHGGETTDVELCVNRPAVYSGWRFYLMDYDHKEQKHVFISARHDPGRNLVIAGIWILIVGTAVLCFRGPRSPINEIPPAKNAPAGLGSQDREHA